MIDAKLKVELLALAHDINMEESSQEMLDLKMYKLKNEVIKLENFDVISKVFLALGATQHDVFD